MKLKKQTTKIDEEKVKQESKEKIKNKNILAYIWCILLGIVIGCAIISSMLFSTVREVKRRLEVYNLDRIEEEHGKEEADSVKTQLIRNMIEEYSLYGYLDDSILEDMKYKELMKTLKDKYSAYYTKAETDNMDDMSGEKYLGIGITITIDEASNLCKVVDVIPGGPTDRAGIMVGDLIIKIDDKPVDTYSPINAVDMINKADNEFNITISRLDEARNSYFKTIEVKKEEIERKYANYKEDGDIGYINMTAFSGNCYEQLREAVSLAIESKKSGIIIDLRENMGGSIDAAQKIAGMFVGHSDICYLQFKPDENGNENKEIIYGSSSKIDKLQEIPIVFLINENTASASELLCGALNKKMDNVELIGNTTYGKGIAQRIEKLTDGSSIKMTVAEYYLFDGTKVNGIGITPDIFSLDEAEQYRLAKEYIHDEIN